MAESPADNVMDVINVVDNASSHQMHLSELLTSLAACKKQVTDSAENAKVTTTAHFASLKKKIMRTLDERVASLLIDIDTARSTALNPLIQCEELIKGHMESTARLIERGGQLLENSSNGEISEINNFINLKGNSTLSILPDVPSLNDVAYISVQLRPSCADTVIDKLSEEGLVLHRSPVKITDVQQCPGGLHISWAETDDESPIDISEFCLQYSLASNNMKASTFKTAYIGPNTCYTLKGLPQDMQYVLRVSCRGENMDDWAMWSVPLTASSSVPHYRWTGGIAGYCLTNESRTLAREGDLLHYPPVIYSSDQTYETGQTITFWVLNANDIGVEDGIAVCLENIPDTSLKRVGSVFVSAKGMVYIDGNEMKNRLPPLVKGSSLTFHTEYLSNGKVRVSADINDKQVTFDWNIEPLTPTLANADNHTYGFNTFMAPPNKSKHMYFAACFTKEDWRVVVE